MRKKPEYEKKKKKVFKINFVLYFMFGAKIQRKKFYRCFSVKIKKYFAVKIERKNSEYFWRENSNLLFQFVWHHFS